LVTKKLLCGLCDSRLYIVFKVTDSFRGNRVCICTKCNLIQSVSSEKYNPKKDTHSVQYIGKRNVEPNSGAMWGNIRHGKGLRFKSHLKKFEKFTKKFKKADIFDDGANRGDFARYIFKRKNFSYFGCEPDRICFQSYDKKTPKIINSYTDNYKFKKKFDIIYSSHTLEHTDSLFNHIKKLDEILKVNGYIFIDLPNTEQIRKEKDIYEEYFVEKHRFHFFPKDIIRVFKNLGYELILDDADIYNFTLILRKKINTKKILKSDFVLHSQNIFKKRIDLLLEYKKKFLITSKRLVKISKKINNLKSKNKIIFYGGGRLLFNFFNNGLTNKNISFIIDNFLFDKTKKINGIKINNKKIFYKMKSRTAPVIVFARSSFHEIKKELTASGFKKIIDFRKLN
jgi:SAM-dependent methyltransferase